MTIRVVYYSAFRSEEGQMLIQSIHTLDERDEAESRAILQEAMRWSGQKTIVYFLDEPHDEKEKKKVLNIVDLGREQYGSGLRKIHLRGIRMIRVIPPHDGVGEFANKHTSHGLFC